MCKHDEVIPLDDVWDHIGESFQAGYIVGYLENLGAKTVFVENEYIDKDYLVDYSGFFSRSFENIDKYTRRIHFFSNTFSQDDFDRLIDSCDGCYIEKHASRCDDDPTLLDDIIKNYLGFVVVKPVRGEQENSYPLIGRTLLGHFPQNVDNSLDTRNFIWRNYSANLCGIPLGIRTLPFQAQDHAVAACATMCLWAANCKINELFGTPELSPIEITDIATRLIGTGRSFPSTGLSIKQMLNFIRSVGLDCDVINIDYRMRIGDDERYSSSFKKKNSEYLKNIVPDTVKALVSVGVPIIATIKLLSREDDNLLDVVDHHSVVISGYRQDDGQNVTEIYIHDDQIGPYSRVESISDDHSFLRWKNKWIEDWDYDEVVLNKLLIPVYPKIRYTYNQVYDDYLNLKLKNPSTTFGLYLTTVQEYKKTLLGFNFINKLDILKRNMPRFIWVISVFEGEYLVREMLYDATSHQLRRLDVIDYNPSLTSYIFPKINS